jgi:hypothetical protein
MTVILEDNSSGKEKTIFAVIVLLLHMERSVGVWRKVLGALKINAAFASSLLIPHVKKAIEIFQRNY